LTRNVKVQKTLFTHQRRYEIDAGDVVDVIDFHIAVYPLVATGFNAGFEYVSIVEMLHRLGAKVDTQVFELTRLYNSRHVGYYYMLVSD